MGTARTESERETWPHSLGRKFCKTALVLVLLAVFAQWYLPYKGHRLGARPEYPQEYLSNETILLRERLDWRDMLSDPEEPYKGLVWDNGMRSSRPLLCAPRPKRALVVGCSCIWGLGVNDCDTYVWKLSELVPNTYFDNAGMVGYGPYRCLQAIRYYMQRQPYDLVIYSAIRNHVIRDVRWHEDIIEIDGQDGQQRDLAFVRAYCQLLPPADEGGLPRLEYRDLHRVHWIGDNCIYLINFIKSSSMHLLGDWIGSEWNRRAYQTADMYRLLALRMRLVINDMCSYVLGRGAKFVVVSLDGVVAEMREMQLLGGRNCRELVPSFPLLEAQYPQDFHTTEGLHTPATKYDNGDHPVPKVHTYFARKIADFLRVVDY